VIRVACYNADVTRTPKGERARESVPRNQGKNTTLITALSLQGRDAELILPGSVHTTTFELSIEQILAAGLQARQIVIMSNLQVHKSAGQGSHRGERLPASLLARLCT
jgi:hypothetical protein